MVNTDGNTFEADRRGRRQDDQGSRGRQEAVVAGRRLPFFPRFVRAPSFGSRRHVSRGSGCEGLENLPASGPLLVICNHASNADGMLLMAYVVPAMGRPMAWLGKEEALRWPLFGWAMRQNGIFGVRRGAGDLEAFKLARRVLDEGRVLAIFPEGTRSPTGALQEAKEGRDGAGRAERRADTADRRSSDRSASGRGASSCRARAGG